MQHLDTPPPPDPRADMEVRIVAWLLGEASPFEAAQVQAALAQDAELAAFCDSIKATIGLVQAAYPQPLTAGQPAAQEPKLSPRRRRALLAHFKLLKAPFFSTAKPPANLWNRWGIALGIAAAFSVFLGVGWVMFSPKLAKAKAVTIARHKMPSEVVATEAQAFAEATRHHQVLVRTNYIGAVPPPTEPLSAERLQEGTTPAQGIIPAQDLAEGRPSVPARSRPARAAVRPVPPAPAAATLATPPAVYLPTPGPAPVWGQDGGAPAAGLRETGFGHYSDAEQPSASSLFADVNGVRAGGMSGAGGYGGATFGGRSADAAATRMGRLAVDAGYAELAAEKGKDQFDYYPNYFSSEEQEAKQTVQLGDAPTLGRSFRASEGPEKRELARAVPAKGARPAREQSPGIQEVKPLASTKQPEDGQRAADALGVHLTPTLKMTDRAALPTQPPTSPAPPPPLAALAPEPPLTSGNAAAILAQESADQAEHLAPVQRRESARKLVAEAPAAAPEQKALEIRNLLRYGLPSKGSALAGTKPSEDASGEPIGETAGTQRAVAKEPAPMPRPETAPLPETLTAENPFSTFSLNVSDVSFKLAAASLENGIMPDQAAIRPEEFINAFNYRDPAPVRGARLAFAWERARYPFAHNRDVLRFAIQTAAHGREPGKPLNLVLLLDNSGSMERPDRVRVVREALSVLAAQLQPQDRISVVAFARTPRLWVDGMPGGDAPALLRKVLELNPHGGTNLELALALAYATAQKHFLPAGNNRVILLTDGAANLGDVDPESLKRTVEEHRRKGIALDCFGVGWEGYNDDLLEVLSRNGDGRYGFLNDPEQAGPDFANLLAGALNVAAADVKTQVEFNPRRVVAWRQIGYARHQLTKEQFHDNTVDAAEIGAAESGNALYVIQVNAGGSGPLGVVRVRYKVPATGQYVEQQWVLPYEPVVLPLQAASPALRLATVAASFAEWLAGSPYAAEMTPAAFQSILQGVPESYAPDPRPQRLAAMLQQARALTGQ